MATLKELKAQVDQARTQRQGEPFEDFASRSWDELPRVKMRDLPRKLHDSTIERFTIDILKLFLKACDSELYKELDALPEAEQKKKIERARANCVFTVDYATEEMEEMTPEEFKTHKTNDKWPPLSTGVFAEQWIEAVEAALHNEKKAGRKKGSTSDLSKVGAVLYVPSRDPYKGVFTLKRNNTAFIAPTAKISVMNNDGTVKTLKPDSEEIQSFDDFFVHSIYTAMVRAKSPTITISIPQFCADIHRDYTDEQFLSKLSELQNDFIGVSDGKRYQILNISAIEPEARRVTISSYYMFQIENEMIRLNTRKPRNKAPWLAPYRNELMRSSIAGARNKPAAEIVMVITNHLVTQGNRPQSKTYNGKDKIFKDPNLRVYHKSVKAIIDECGQFKDKLYSYQKTRDQNKALQRAFTGAYDYLLKYTVCNEYYIDFTIAQSPRPTMNSLKDDQIIITYSGINGDYKEP